MCFHIPLCMLFFFFLPQCHLIQHHQPCCVFIAIFFDSLSFPSSILYRFSYRFATQYNLVCSGRDPLRFFYSIIHMQVWKMFEHLTTIGQRIILIWHWLLSYVHYKFVSIVNVILFHLWFLNSVSFFFFYIDFDFISSFDPIFRQSVKNGRIFVPSVQFDSVIWLSHIQSSK